MYMYISHAILNCDHSSHISKTSGVLGTGAFKYSKSLRSKITYLLVALSAGDSVIFNLKKELLIVGCIQDMHAQMVILPCVC